MSKEAIQSASMIGALGMDPMRFLTTKDDVERQLMVELANRMQKHREVMDNNLAVKIVEQVSKLFKK